MLPLKARKIDSNIINKYNEDEGFFVRVFLISDQRNRNQWRVTWDSIKKHYTEFIGKPGIAYEQCTRDKCELDHTTGATYEQAISRQEKYRVSTIIDVILAEAEHTVYAIHKIHDEQFADRIKSGEVQYVSPSVWIMNKRYDYFGTDPLGQKIIDIHDWKAVHSAWVTKPAFGDDSKITDQCADSEENCMLRLKPIQDQAELPVMLKHAKHQTYVTVSKSEYDKLNQMQFTDQDIDTPKCNCNTKNELDVMRMNLQIANMRMNMRLPT